MTTTSTPVYLRSHAGHCSTDPRYATTGFDVVRTEVIDGIVHIDVVEVVHGDATSYMEALTKAKALRGGGVWGYPAERHACGCRWVGTVTGGTAIVQDLTVAQAL